jgi:hypothetical protein
MQPATAIAVLLERLNWPVREVKLCAARAIASLMQSNDGVDVLAAYLDWMKRRVLESEVASGLAVILALPEEKRPRFADVRDSVQRPSPLADMMLQFAYGRGNVQDGWRKAHSGPAPASFKPDQAFLDYRASHVPPILNLEIDKLEAKSGKAFAKQWAYEWRCLMDATGAPHAGPPHYFAPYGIYRTGIMAQVSQRQCDVYRSAYQRTLAFAVDAWAMPAAKAGRLCLHSLPVSGGLMQLDPIDRPAWLDDRPAPGANAATLELFARRVTRRGLVTPGRRPVAIKTPLPVEVAEFGQLTVSAMLVSDNFSPPANWTYGHFTRAVQWFLPDHFNFEGELPSVGIDDFMERGDSGAAAPFTLDIWATPGGFWHNDIFALGLALPAPYAFSSQASIACDRHSINLVGAGRPRAATSIWNDHWTPLHPPQGPTRCGLVSELDENEIASALDRHRMKLGWVVEMRWWPDNDRLERREPIDTWCYLDD